MSAVSIGLYVLGALLIIVLLIALFWWLRTQSGTAIRSFYAAVRKMEHDHGIESRYQVPWFMLLGDPREGTQLCADWQLSPVGRSSWFGRWWADPDGAVLVVPQSIFLPHDNNTAPTFIWRRLLGILQRLRGQRPLDGVIWVIPLAQLQDEEQLAADVLVMRRRFAEMLQRLGLSLPVYVIVSGLEALPGFQELLSVLPEDSHDQAFGWSSPYALDANWQSYWLDDAADQLVQATQAAVLESAALRGELNEDLYRLPDQLIDLKNSLRMLLEPIFQGNAQGEAPRLRGIYLSGARATLEDDPLSAVDQSGLRGVFTRQLWIERFQAEQGLAQAVPRILQLRQRWQKTVALSAIVIGIGWGVAMLWVWQERLADARVLSRLLQETHATHQSISTVSSERNQAYTRHNVQSFWLLLQQAPRWHYASLVYPTSWGTSIDDQLDRLLSAMAKRSVVTPLRQLQVDELSRVEAIRITDRRSNVEGAIPDQWPSFVKARMLVNSVMKLERDNRLLNSLLLGQQGVVEPLAQLGNDSLGLNLDPTSLRNRAFYDRTLRDLSSSNLAPPDLESMRVEIADQFQGLMKYWLAQYFLADNFVKPAGYLKRYLSDMEGGRDITLNRLEEINAYIAYLEDLIVLTNSAWSHGNNDELTPGYRALMEDVRQSSLLGPATADALDQQAKKLRQDFHTQWIEHTASRGSLLQRQAGGTLMLQESISDLSRSIDSLLKRDFALVALRDPEALLRRGSPIVMTEQRIAQALAYQQSYRDYVAKELALISPDYRAGMLKAAGDTAALAIWSALTRSSERTYDSGMHDTSAFGEQAMYVIQGLTELGRSDLSSDIQMQLTLQAMANVESALSSIDSLALFKQRVEVSDWNGSPNLGLQLYRATDVQDLKSFLDSQFVAVSNSSDAVVQELNWLRSQRNLPLAIQDKVARLASIQEEMVKYKAQNPASAPALFSQLVTRDLIDIDLSSCNQVLSTASLPQGEGDFSRYANGLLNQTLARCHELQLQSAFESWDTLTSYFNQYLAGRFPFAYSLESSDADPARVKHLLELIDTHVESAEKGLQLVPANNRLAAQDFLSRMKQARSWLGPLLIRDKSGVLGVELEVRWRTDREEERGADQVIAWTIRGASQKLGYPGDSGERLRWLVGDPLQLALRWARDSNQRPASDPLQPSMAVNELEAGWEYQGAWSLLRLLRTHVIPQRLLNMDYTDFPLTLQVPVRGTLDANESAQMFMRLSLLSQGSKLPLAIQPLPVVAPSSPFTNSHFSSGAVLP
ncbi:type VI secretion system protein ImpL [Pseudomonas sp. HMWF032]|uniref:type VI secretion system protein n=1 Tax=Pseudomonas sp. HMWF032 TaxID=2056866 RepID=UPI000D3B2BBE|nr:type VI secretion protein IcmF/TssM N-terminal domain-containing protein [Pseudomonas sp. HMWF032]PTS84371.1 type VI secretion system protein ImpL [Pseudomonas sp. HMWF032]PTT83788.1 type VI secretion system protein ImpL [Pseudomonas sp. HMWF010]